MELAALAAEKFDDVTLAQILEILRSMRNECSLGEEHQDRNLPQLSVCAKVLKKILNNRGELMGTLSEQIKKLEVSTVQEENEEGTILNEREVKEVILPDQIADIKVLKDESKGAPPEDEIPNKINEKEMMILRVGIQFMANMTVSNDKIAREIWDQYKELIFELFNINDKAVRKGVCMLLNNCLNREEVVDEIVKSLLEGLVDEAKEGENEFAQFVLEALVKGRLKEVYFRVEGEGRLYLLDLMEGGGAVLVPRAKELMERVLGYGGEVSSWEAQEIDRLLEVLGRETSLRDQSLLIDVCCMLVAAAQTRIPPSPHLKARLVRLIANLVYENMPNQDVVRELKCLPLVLDCCRIDEQNPFILEWAILAIRNLCYNNPANQREFAELRNTSYHPHAFHNVMSQ